MKETPNGQHPNGNGKKPHGILHPIRASHDIADAIKALPLLDPEIHKVRRREKQKNLARGVSVIVSYIALVVGLVFAGVQMYPHARRILAGEEDVTTYYTPNGEELSILKAMPQEEYELAIKNKKNLKFLGTTLPGIKTFFATLFDNIRAREGTAIMSLEDKKLLLDIYKFFKENIVPVYWDEHDKLREPDRSGQQFECAELDDWYVTNPEERHSWFLEHGIPYFHQENKTLFVNRPLDSLQHAEAPYVQFDYVLALRDAYFIMKEGKWLPADDIPVLAMEMPELFKMSFDDKKWEKADTQEAVLEILVHTAMPMVGGGEWSESEHKQRMEAMIWRVANWCFMKKVADPNDPRAQFLFTYMKSPQTIRIPEVAPPKSEPMPQTMRPPDGYSDCKPEPDMKAAMQTIITSLAIRGTITDAQQADALPLAQRGECWKLLAIQDDPRNRDLFLYDEPNWLRMLEGGQNTTAPELPVEATRLIGFFRTKGRPAIYTKPETPPAALMQDDTEFAYMSLTDGTPPKNLVRRWFQEHDVPYFDSSTRTLSIRQPREIKGVKPDGVKLLGVLRQFENWIALNDARQIAGGGITLLSDPTAAKILGDDENLIGLPYSDDAWANATTLHLIFERLKEGAKIIVQKTLGESGGDSAARATLTEAAMYTEARWILMRKIRDPNDIRHKLLSQLVLLPHAISLGKKSPE
ncbi:MAG: hypothetical protein AAB588_02305 [Patescibacteria group bacterium]